MLGRNRFQIKTPDQIRTMRRAGLVVAEGLEAMSAVAVPGATTADIDNAGRKVLKQHGAGSNFLNYGGDWGLPPYPGVACVSPNLSLIHISEPTRQVR